MEVELEATVKQALAEIFDIIKNQQTADLMRIQNDLARVETEFVSKMNLITAIAWVSFAISVGLLVYALVKRYGRKN